MPSIINEHMEAQQSNASAVKGTGKAQKRTQKKKEETDAAKAAARKAQAKEEFESSAISDFGFSHINENRRHAGESIDPMVTLGNAVLYKGAAYTFDESKKKDDLGRPLFLKINVTIDSREKLEMFFTEILGIKWVSKLEEYKALLDPQDEVDAKELRALDNIERVLDNVGNIAGKTLLAGCHFDLHYTDVLDTVGDIDVNTPGEIEPFKCRGLTDADTLEDMNMALDYIGTYVRQRTNPLVGDL